MKVNEWMTKDVVACRPEDGLDRAAQIMWDRDCGIVPVVDPGGRVVGMVTDRDACMAAYTKGLPLDRIRVGEVMSKQVYSCHAEDELPLAEATMQHHRVRRMPVVDGEGRLKGIVSLNDLARGGALERARGSDGLSKEVAATLAAICQPWSEGAPSPALPAAPGRGEAKPAAVLAPARPR